MNYLDSGKVWLIRIDEWGNTLWTHKYGINCNEAVRSVWPTADGGFILAGMTDHGIDNRDTWIIRLNELGDTLWTHSYGGVNPDEAWSVQQTIDGGYVIVGWTESYGAGAADFWLIRTDELGDTLWSRTFGGPDWDEAHSVQQTAEGGFIIVGTTESFGVRRLNENNQIQSQKLENYLQQNNYLRDPAKTWLKNNFASNFDQNGEITISTDEFSQQILGACSRYSTKILRTTVLPYTTNIWMVRTDQFGDTLWTRTYGDSGSQVAHTVKQTSDDGFIVAGSTEQIGSGNINLWLIRTDSFGDTLWTSTLDHDLNDVAYDCRQTTDQGFIVAGKAGYDVYSDVWLLRLAPELSTGQNEFVEIPARYFLEQNFPNPFNPSTTITYLLPQRSEVIIKVYDLLGQEVSTLVNANQAAGVYQVLWDGNDQSNLPVSSGVYIYTLQAKNYFASRKMLVLK